MPGLPCICHGSAIIAVPLFVFFFLSLFFHLDPAPVQTFANQSLDVLSAKVLASGMSHACPDFPWSAWPPSAECLEDRTCTGVAKQLLPTVAEVQTVENTHHSSRELGAGRCHSIFSPWLKVLLHDGEEQKVHCAWWYGTKANTEYIGMDSFDDAKQLLAAHPEGSELLVWSLPTAEHCLVGVGDLADLAFAAEQVHAASAHPTWQTINGCSDQAWVQCQMRVTWPAFVEWHRT
jgi:hypothetical protein